MGPLTTTSCGIYHGGLRRTTINNEGAAEAQTPDSVEDMCSYDPTQ